MTTLRISPAMVEQIGRLAAELTKDAVFFDRVIKGDGAGGVTYIGHSDLMAWHGPLASRRAAAYYMGAIFGALQLKPGELPPWYAELLTQFDPQASSQKAVKDEWIRGVDAAYKKRRKIAA